MQVQLASTEFTEQDLLKLETAFSSEQIQVATNDIDDSQVMEMVKVTEDAFCLAGFNYLKSYEAYNKHLNTKGYQAQLASEQWQALFIPLELLEQTKEGAAYINQQR